MIADAILVCGAACLAMAAYIVSPTLCWAVVGVELIVAGIAAAKE